MGEETTIMGTVLSVVFQNEENGYAVLRLVTDDGELLTLVGCVPRGGCRVRAVLYGPVSQENAALRFTHRPSAP